MINLIWFGLIICGVIVAAFNGRIEMLSIDLINETQSAVEFVIGLTGTLMLWSGLMRIAVKSGLNKKISILLSPLLRKLFPQVPKGHQAFGYISMAMSSNILGLGNASTPLGLKAMEELQKLNIDKATASDSMCTLLAITTSSITLIPATVIAMRSQTGSSNPAEIIGTTLVATLFSTLIAVIADRLFRQINRKRRYKRR